MTGGAGGASFALELSALLPLIPALAWTLERVTGRAPSALSNLRADTSSTALISSSVYLLRSRGASPATRAPHVTP
jgi:hypothetical protein